MKYGKLIAALVAVVWLAPQSAQALSVEATITADNHYALYYGNEDGSSLTYVGRNELGSNGAPGQYNWSKPEPFSFDMNKGDYLYLAAWSDNSVAQGILGQFVVDGGYTFYTTPDDNTGWEYISTYQDLGDGSPAPTVATMYSFIYPAVWLEVMAGLAHGSAPWGVVAGISASADWMWAGPLVPGDGTGEFHIFRVGVVPEPSTMILFGSAAFGELLRRRRAVAKA